MSATRKAWFGGALLIGAALWLSAQAPDGTLWVPIFDTKTMSWPAWKKLGTGFVVEGQTISVAPLPAPGTNPPPALPRFHLPDFIVTVDSDGVQRVAIRWAAPIEGGLAAGTRDFSLLGFKTRPLSCAVYRDGILQSWAFGQYEFAAPAEGNDWILRFSGTSDKSQLIQAHCIGSP